jgi:pimeloyl-ACP methyl ester carboxylesterase
MSRRRNLKFRLGLGLGAGAGYAVAQQLWALGRLARINVRRALAAPVNQNRAGLTFSETTETSTCTLVRTTENGIERVSCFPRQRRFATPIVMQHGMWHGAWCWQPWQELLAEWGWETHAHSLPGHAGSPLQRPIARCTLDYYLGFVKAEAERLPRRPVLMGHSMGGALIQWYLKHVGDLPAAVLVAPWVSHSMFAEGLGRLLKLDPPLYLWMMRAWDATPFVRSPQVAARALISPSALYSPEQLYARLGPESALVLYQHNPPFWSPPEAVHTPMLWLAGGQDAFFSVGAERRSAAHYGAEFVVVPGAGHNVMMEPTYRQTAEQIHAWLVRQGID